MIKSAQVVCIFLNALCLVNFSHAQTVTATVHGMVIDGAGAAVANAAVSFISQNTGDTTTVVSGKTGSYSANLALFPTSVGHDGSAVRGFRLLQNYPNPFNPSTVIPLELSSAADITLSIFNVLGQEITTLYSGVLPDGRHTFSWDGRDFGGRGVPAGLYICRLLTERFAETRKMLLIDGNASALNTTFSSTGLAKTAGESAFKIVVQKAAFLRTIEEQFIIDSQQTDVEKNITLPVLKNLAAVNYRVGYQTIEGFGGHGGFANWYNSPVFTNLLLNDMGLTILRTNIPPSLESVNDDNDPNHFNWEGFKLNGSDGEKFLGIRLDYLKTMTAGGNVKIISTVWSPPGWMKKSGQADGKREATPDPYSTDCALKDNMFDEFAEFIVAYILLMKQEAGIDVYAISVQNEPAFEEPYHSCVYSPNKLANLVAVVGARIEKDGLATKIFAAEDLGYHSRVMSFLNACMDNPDARKYIGANAVHGYDLDGKTGQGYQASQWQELYETGAKYDIPLWMTETSGYANDWAGALKMAQAIHFGLYYGKISAWVHWSLSVSENNPDSYPYGLILGLNRLTARYNVSKQYYKFIRPGMVQRAGSAFDEDVLIAAFQQPESDQWAIVLINRGSAVKQITLTGDLLPDSFKMYRSSPYENCFQVGTVTPEVPFTLIGESVVTLVH